jgi:hypothetical protein
MNKRCRLFWLALFLEAAGWQLLIPVFTPWHWAGLVFLALAALTFGLSLTGAQGAQPRPHPTSAGTANLVPRSALCCYGVTAVLAYILLPSPLWVSAVFILTGVVALWFSPEDSGSGAFAYGVLLTGVIALCQSALLPLWMSVAARVHPLPHVAPILRGLFEFAGYRADWTADSVFVQGSFQVQEFSASSEYFGWIFLANAACGLWVWQVLCRSPRRVRGLIGFGLVALVYVLGRYLLLALLYLDLPNFRLFWNPWILCFSFLPLFGWMCVSGWFSAEGGPVNAEPPGPATNAARGDVRWAWVSGGLAGAAATCCFVAAWGWEDPGTAKARRLIIDEAHSRWELMDRKYDTDWYGEESGYNYFCLADFLEHYYRVERNRSEITPALLADCDLLILKTPTSPFTADEIEAIERFVARGGGLFLIGDHTNVFGTSTFLNSIARRFGLHFNLDATYDLPTGGLTLYRRPPLLPHPIVQRLPPFLFGTSCTLGVSPGAQVPINGYALRVAGHDYSTPSFFTARTDGPFIGFGMFPQLAAVKHQRGRVAAFSDSTVFSNFWMFVPGKPELLLGCTDWLNRENKHPKAVLLFLMLGTVFGGVSLRCLRGRGTGQFPFLLASVALGCFTGVLGLAALNRSSYPLPASQSRYRTVCFDRQYSHFDLPDQRLMLEPKLDFHTFYVWAQRVGYVPRVADTLAEAVTCGEGVVLLNPTGRVALADIRRVEQFVQQGGVLYVFASPGDQAAGANAWLAGFGLRIGSELLLSQTVSNAAGEVVGSNQNTRIVSGGTGLLFAADRQAVLATKRHGKGAVIVSGNSELFAASSLGTVNRIPDKAQRRLYDIIFRIFREIERTGAEGGEPHTPR